MEFHRHDNCTPMSGRGRMVMVSAPAAHAGVGDALRRAYREGRDELPRELMQLLDRLC